MTTRSKTKPVEAEAENRTDRWQRRLLPLMAGSIVLLAGFFLVASLYQLNRLQESASFSSLDLEATFQRFDEQDRGKDISQFEYLQLRVLSLLEQNAIEHRYQQANAAMLARVWTRYLGFLTGMILALVGSAFILGKLQTDPTEIDAASDLWKASLKTTSPGIVLAVLGTILMFTTLLVPFEISTKDAAVYLHGSRLPVPPPPAWENDDESMKAREQELFGTSEAPPSEEKDSSGDSKKEPSSPEGEGS